MILPTGFYLQDAPSVAQKLLGQVLVHETSQGRISGIIVETEAYLSANDPASHSCRRGRTKRNASMFGPPGTSYVYLIYGIHYCFNAVCQPQGVGEAVLVRALQPLEGIAYMQHNRGQVPKQELTNGPGKLTQALGIDLDQDGQALTSPPLYIRRGTTPAAITASPRIGISVGTELPLRFFITGNRYVSR